MNYVTFKFRLFQVRNKKHGNIPDNISNLKTIGSLVIDILGIV